MEYTDQEIEMLARFAHEASGDTSTWDSLRDERKRDMRAYAIEKTSQRTLRSPIVRAAARLMREAREQGAAERAKYRADDIVLARSPLAASCVWQGVTAQAAANAFEYELHELTQEFIRFQTNSSAAVTIKLDAMSTDMIAKAREQGAAEMKERAAELVRSACHDHPSTREILANIRSLPLTSTLDERDRLDAEIAAVERSDQ